MWLRHIHHPRDYLSISEKDGVWDSSYVSTGVYDENVNKTLGESKRAGDSDNSSDLGNGEVSYGYAVRGVEFTYLHIGDIIQYTGSANDGAADNHIEILYGIDKAVGDNVENRADQFFHEKIGKFIVHVQLDAAGFFIQSRKCPLAVQFSKGTVNQFHFDGFRRDIDIVSGKALPDAAKIQGEGRNRRLAACVSLYVDTVAPWKKRWVRFDVFHQGEHLFCAIVLQYGFVYDRHL